VVSCNKVRSRELPSALILYATTSYEFFPSSISLTSHHLLILSSNSFREEVENAATYSHGQSSLISEDVATPPLVAEWAGICGREVSSHHFDTLRASGDATITGPCPGTTHGPEHTRMSLTG
jgi:hypothetical protein